MLKNLGSGLLLVLAIAIVLFGYPQACQDPKGAREILEHNGYTDIRITGYRWFACSESDAFSTGFVAKSASGQRVTGEVCSGFLKGSTIRFD